MPPALKNVVLRTLDLGLLQAGAGVKGEFENRLKSVIEEVKSSPQPIIMFIDEAHTLIGAGGQAGQGDAANLLKPALARGEMRTIAATTWAEYKKYFETRRRARPALPGGQGRGADRAGSGRPCCAAWSGTLEKHHQRRASSTRRSWMPCGCRIATSPGRQLPDKAVSLIDTACARVAMSQAATPAAIEDHRRDGSMRSAPNSASSVASWPIGRGDPARARRRSSSAARACTRSLWNSEERLKQERTLVDRIVDLRGKPRAGAPAAAGARR